MNLPNWIFSLLMVCGSVSALWADDELLPADRPISEVVDDYIDAKLAEKQIEPTAPATDEVFLRRLTLDLAGRIPTRSELVAYRESADPAKKTQTIERLLNAPDFAYQQR
ncbi:MAG TPA: DUF1549 domain-containing protein, partial [Planctomycetaceae bacterium]|nr:DUF1549 domain-containing protein [Planctomycetaceae bacterium]